MNTTTRRFYRSMSEAFHDANYACAIERTRRDSFYGVVLACSIGIALAALIFFGASS